MSSLPDPVNKMLIKDEFSKWLGIEVLEAANGKAKVKMKVRKEMLNGFNICHGGIAFSLADSAMAFASNSEGKLSLSIDNSITYHEKIVEGDVLLASAEEISSGNKVSVYHVIITNNVRVHVAHFRGIVYKTGRELSINE